MMSRPAQRARSESVPKAMAERHRALVALTDAFCRRYLNEDYAELARRAVAALCRKRPSPLSSGQANAWACGVIHALGQVNFLSDKGTSPYLSTQDLCAGFGVAPSTGGSKAKAVRDALGMKRWDHRWLLPGNIESMSAVWMLQVDGLIVDVRDMPRPVQVAAHDRGLIPYVPADGPEGDGGTRQAILDRYDGHRRVNTALQSALAGRLLHGPIAAIAARLGLIDVGQEMAEDDLEDIDAAADLALYAAAGGMTAVQRYAAEIGDTLSDPERRMLQGMCAAEFSIFRISGCHRGAGVDLTDLISGRQVWVVDRSLEASAYAGTELTLRLFRPDEFWMTTGVAIALDEGLWRELESAGLIRRKALPTLSLDRDALAEAIYRLVGDWADAP
jgi:hypothetical protein